MRTNRFYTAADGTRVWYGTVGQGPPMVLLDGLACDGFIWAYLIDHFCADYTIVRVHYRGHGRSEAPEQLDALGMDALCGDIRGIFDELEIEQAVLVGHSMGAQVLFELYDRAPAQVAALIPVCGSYKRPLDTFHDSDFLWNALPYLENLIGSAPELVQSFWTKVLPMRLTQWFAHVTDLNNRLVHPDDFRPYLEHAARMDVRVFIQMLRNLAEHSAESILPTIDVPTLIIAAELDTFTPLPRSLEMHELIPHSELVVLPGGSHAGPIELPETVIGAMEKFLRQHVPI